MKLIVERAGVVIGYEYQFFFFHSRYFTCKDNNKSRSRKIFSCRTCTE